MCSSRFLAAFSCGLALALGFARVTAQDNTCSLPPAASFNPYLLNYDRQHTYNPYSSKDNEVANVNHEPKAPGEKGHWISKSYKVGCGADSGLFKETYLSAAVGSQTEGGVCSGTYLHIANLSPKYPAYFGVDGLLNDHLEPKQRKVIHLPRYAPGVGTKPAVVANVYVKYWDDEGVSSTAQIAGRCNTLFEYFHTLESNPNRGRADAAQRIIESMTPTLTGEDTPEGILASGLVPRYGHLTKDSSLLWDGYFRFFNDTGRRLFFWSCTDEPDNPQCSGRILRPHSEDYVFVVHDNVHRNLFRVFAEPATNLFSSSDELIFDPSDSSNWSYHKDKK